MEDGSGNEHIKQRSLFQHVTWDGLAVRHLAVRSWRRFVLFLAVAYDIGRDKNGLLYCVCIRRSDSISYFDNKSENMDNSSEFARVTKRTGVFSMLALDDVSSSLLQDLMYNSESGVSCQISIQPCRATVNATPYPHAYPSAVPFTRPQKPGPSPVCENITTTTATEPIPPHSGSPLITPSKTTNATAFAGNALKKHGPKPLQKPLIPSRRQTSRAAALQLTLRPRSSGPVIRRCLTTSLG